MRYKISDVPVEGGAYGGSGDFVEFTVWLTFVIGLGFLYAGIRGRQRWLAAWGGLTVLACTGYWVMVWLGWP